jgi:cation transport regulator ChaC
MPDPKPVAYVFGYASLVALPESLSIEGAEHSPVRGRLLGFRRYWGAAMNNWEGGEDVKHFLDRESGERPRIRVAYLDVEPQDGCSVNGVAIPVDAERMEMLDAREINYSRLDVSAAFEPQLRQRVFTYIGLDSARERCRQGAAEGNVFVSSDYAGSVRRAFERLDPQALAEFERTTDPLPFPERDLRVVLPTR